MEKPAHPRSDLANAGMYAFHPSVLDLIDGPAAARHRLRTCCPGSSAGPGSSAIGDGYFVDIGTPEALERARD